MLTPVFHTYIHMSEPQCIYSRWTKDSLVKPRKYFPRYQNTMPQRQKIVMSAIVVKTGGMNPASSAHGVIYLLNP